MIVLALVVARVDYISDPCEETGVTETYSGGRFDPFAPYSSDVNIEDVSVGLGHAFWRSCLLAVMPSGGHCRDLYGSPFPRCKLGTFQRGCSTLVARHHVCEKL
jgi:hypothetical protein